jgi:mono/diheme cytochrome c family protein
MQYDHSWERLARSLLVFLVLMALTACNGGGPSPSAQTGAAEADQPAAVETMPSARFTAVGEQSEFSRTVVLTATAPVSVALAAPAPAVDLERGARAYARNKCGECHGEAGEGLAGKGKAIAGTPLSAAEFERIVRTGGGLGNTHIFGPSAVSPAGMGALYAYVQSLK